MWMTHKRVRLGSSMPTTYCLQLSTSFGKFILLLVLLFYSRRRPLLLLAPHSACPSTPVFSLLGHLWVAPFNGVSPGLASADSLYIPSLLTGARCRPVLPGLVCLGSWPFCKSCSSGCYHPWRELGTWFALSARDCLGSKSPLLMPYCSLIKLDFRYAMPAPRSGALLVGAW